MPHAVACRMTCLRRNRHSAGRGNCSSRPRAFPSRLTARGPVLAMNRRTWKFPRVFARIGGSSHPLPHPIQPDRSVALVDDRLDMAKWTIVGIAPGLVKSRPDNRDARLKAPKRDLADLDLLTAPGARGTAPHGTATAVRIIQQEAITGLPNDHARSWAAPPGSFRRDGASGGPLRRL